MPQKPTESSRWWEPLIENFCEVGSCSWHVSYLSTEPCLSGMSKLPPGLPGSAHLVSAFDRCVSSLQGTLQWWNYWHLAGIALCCGAGCTVHLRCLAAPLPLSLRCQEQPPPQLWQPEMSPDVPNIPGAFIWVVHSNHLRSFKKKNSNAWAPSYLITS